MDQATHIALIDTQPGAKNHPLTEHNQPQIVIDHHGWRASSALAQFVDVRPDIGASATILTGYMQAANIHIPSSLATALFYGIKTDTMGLGRGASPDDTAAYFFLQPQIDVDALVQIECAQVSKTYFKSLNDAMRATWLYDDLVIAYLGVVKYPDLGAEIADLLWRLKGINWVVCMGVYADELILSVRSRSRKIGAGTLVEQIVGNLGVAGGHGTMAGGHIPLNRQNPAQLSEQLTKTALQFTKGDASFVGKQLI